MSNTQLWSLESERSGREWEWTERDALAVQDCAVSWENGCMG